MNTKSSMHNALVTSIMYPKEALCIKDKRGTFGALGVFVFNCPNQLVFHNSRKLCMEYSLYRCMHAVTP